jgi:hypothetical protein
MVTNREIIWEHQQTAQPVSIRVGEKKKKAIVARLLSAERAKYSHIEFPDQNGWVNPLHLRARNYECFLTARPMNGEPTTKQFVIHAKEGTKVASAWVYVL